MDELLGKIESVLKSEVDLHHVMINASNELNKALKKGDIDGVNKCRIVHDEAICNVERLETERIDYCNKAAAGLGIERTTLKLSMIIGKVPQLWRTRLEFIHNALKEKIKELSFVTVSNRILIEEGLKMIGNTFSIVRQAGNKYAAYGTRGQSVTAPMIRSIVNRTM